MRPTSPILSPGKNEHGLTELDAITFLQRVSLILIDQLPIDLRAIGATLVLQRIVAIAHIENGGMQARDCQILKEDVAFAAAPDAERFLADLVNATRLFPFFDADNAKTGSRLLRGCAPGPQHGFICVQRAEQSARIWFHARGGDVLPKASLLPRRRRRGRGWSSPGVLRCLGWLGWLPPGGITTTEGRLPLLRLRIAPRRRLSGCGRGIPGRRLGRLWLITPGSCPLLSCLLSRLSPRVLRLSRRSPWVGWLLRGGILSAPGWLLRRVLAALTAPGTGILLPWHRILRARSPCTWLLLVLHPPASRLLLLVLHPPASRLLLLTPRARPGLLVPCARGSLLALPIAHSTTSHLAACILPAP